MQQLPDLRFELLAVFTGVNTVAIHYLGARGQTAVEFFFFNGAGLVYKALAQYAL